MEERNNENEQSWMNLVYELCSPAPSIVTIFMQIYA